MFFDGIGAVDPQDSYSGRLATRARASARAPASLCASSSNSAGSTEIGRACTSVVGRRVRRSSLEVALGADDVLARAQEVPAPAVGVEADDVVREQPVVDRAPDRPRAARASSRAAARGCGRSARARRPARALAHEPRREVQVVVVEEDGRVGLARRARVDHGVGEASVDRDVAVVQAWWSAGSTSGAYGEVPEVVLDEPQHRVRDDVVVPVVRLRVVRDEPQPVRRAVARSLLDASPPASATTPVLVGHRARDPGHVVVRDEAAQRRHEPAAAAPRDARSRRRRASYDDRARGSRRRSACGGTRHRLGAYVARPTDDLERRLAVSLPSSRLKSTSQSRSSRGVRKCRRTSSLPRSARCRAPRRVVEDLEARLGALRRRVDEPAGLAVLDLRDDPARRGRRRSGAPSRAPPSPSGRSPPGSTSGSRPPSAPGRR